MFKERGNWPRFKIGEASSHMIPKQTVLYVCTVLIELDTIKRGNNRQLLRCLPWVNSEVKKRIAQNLKKSQ